MLQPAIDALAALGLASGVQHSAPVYALVSASHVFGIALLVGPILLADLRLLGLLRGLDGPALLTLRRAARIGVVLAVSTGVLLLSAKPAEYAENRVVWIKLAVVAAAIANALLFEFRGQRGEGAAQGRMAPLASITLWLSALLLGRWIAFV